MTLALIRAGLLRMRVGNARGARSILGSRLLSSLGKRKIYLKKLGCFNFETF